MNVVRTRPSAVLRYMYGQLMFSGGLLIGFIFMCNMFQLYQHWVGGGTVLVKSCPSRNLLYFRSTLLVRAYRHHSKRENKIELLKTWSVAFDPSVEGGDNSDVLVFVSASGGPFRCEALMPINAGGLKIIVKQPWMHQSYGSHSIQIDG